MSKFPKIVVTGFEPFAHGSENPTLEVLAQLRRANDIEGDLTTIQLPVDSARIAAITSENLDSLRPDLWISLGLAPIVVRDIYARLPSILAEGISLVIVEQDIAQALKAAAQVYCLQEGRVALQGPARDLTRQAIAAAYFGG